jgi:hypothetical protein
MFVVAALVVLSACTSTNKATPPPTGGFSNTNLNGTYVFSSSGTDSNANTPEFIAMAGTFTACGCTGGTISAAGFVDVNDPNLAAPVTHDAVTGGTYDVGVDGRGSVSLTLATPLPSPFPSGSITLRFVLSSSQGGLVTEFDANGSGSGTLDLQSSPAQTAGTYVFNLGGIAGVTVAGVGVPLATVGSVTLDGSGNVTATGVQDLNNGGADSLLSIATSSTIPVDTSPTTATLVTSGGTFTFDVYAISPTHFKLIETDVAPILVGDVFSQSSSSFPSGELAFTMAGVDIVAEGPLVVGGMMNASGAGVEDFNDVIGGVGVSNITSTTSAPIGFTLAVGTLGGRSVVTFNPGFENGNNGNVTVPYTFAAYPSTGGTQLLEIDGLGITDGVAYPQASTSFTTGQGYGLNLTGNNGSEVDEIAEFTDNSSNTLTGLIDINTQGAPSMPQNFGATYAADTTNLGRGLIASTTSATPNLTSYTVDSATSIFIEIDQTQVGLGSIGQQASTAQGAIAHVAAIHHVSIPRAASKKKAAEDQNK